MNDLIKIEVIFDNQLSISCNYVMLEPFATTMARSFHFQNIKEKISQVQINEALIFTYEEIMIRISVRTRFNDFAPINEFEIYARECTIVNKLLIVNGLCFLKSGSINPYYFYRQGVIDVYNLWQVADNNFTIPSNLKKDYLTACVYYNDGKWNIIKRDKYIIDWSKIEVEEDFFIQAGYVFCGEKGYCGYSLHTLADCLIDFYKQTDCFQDINIIFRISNVKEHPLKLFFEDVKAIYKKYDKINFTVEFIDYNT